MSQWFSVNNLVLNAKKTKLLRFSPPNTRLSPLNIELDARKLEIVNSTSFLGINIDFRLQWGSHIEGLAKRLSSAAFAVKNIRKITNQDTARLVYFAYFHSIMSYGLLLWGSAADINRIFILQKRAVRFIYQLKPRDSLQDLFKDIDILTLPSLYIFVNIMYVRKNLHLYTKNNEVHGFNTRNRNKLCAPKLRLSKSSKSFIGNSIRFYNKIPDNVTALTDIKFKTHVKHVLIKKAYYKVNDYIADKCVWK